MCSEDKSGFYIIVWITSVVPNFLGQNNQGNLYYYIEFSLDKDLSRIQTRC